MQPADPALKLAWAQKLFREHGISCFPIAKGAKRPLVRTSEWWGKHFPVDALARFNGCNIAAQTGLVSSLLVIDVDSVQTASQWFKAMPVLPASWSVRTGGGGLHLWFRVPSYWKNEFGRTQIWKGEGKHEEVAVIFGRGMAICPPSRFPGSLPYRWESDRSPLTRSLGFAPEWLLKACVATKAPRLARTGDLLPVGTAGNAWSDFAGLVPDKLSLLIGWGLRLAGSQNASGWIPCYRPGDVTDTVASASVRPDTGQVWTSTRGTLSFVASAVALGAFTTEEQCVEWIRANYGG